MHGFSLSLPPSRGMLEETASLFCYERVRQSGSASPRVRQSGSASPRVRVCILSTPLINGRLSMSFDDSIPFCVCSGSRRSVYTTFSRLKLAAAKLRQGPNPGLKLAAAYFSRKEIVRLYRRSRLILAAAYLSHGFFSLV